MTEKFLLIAVYFGGILVYAILNVRTRVPYDFRTSLDRWIPFIPAFVIPYFGLFVFVPVAAWFLFPTERFVPYVSALVIATYAAAVSWYFFPARTYRPRIAGTNLLEKVIAILYRDDPHANGFPSTHVFTSVISSSYLAAAFPQEAALVWAVGSLIALSTVFVKQHQVVDVLGGIFWAVAAIMAVRYGVG